MSPSFLSSLTRSKTPITTPTRAHKLTSLIPPNLLSTTTPRKIARIVPALETHEGVGATVHRSIGTPRLHHFNPFLMLDYALVQEGAGFPDHPHRGQETISYVLSGKLEHEDFAGNKGVLRKGDLQFMTAGRGIMHSEMPVPSEDGSPSIGLQLWVDLPQELKMSEPRYRDVRGQEVKEAIADEGRVVVKVISGNSYGVQSLNTDLTYTPVWYLDFVVKPGGRVKQALPKGWNAFTYVLEGELDIKSEEADRSVKPHEIVTLEQEGDSFEAGVSVDAKGDVRFVLIAGLPLDQSVVQHGPFVMTSREDIRQAVTDFMTHSNGFERAEKWESQAEKRRKSLS